MPYLGRPMTPRMAALAPQYCQFIYILHRGGYILHPKPMLPLRLQHLHALLHCVVLIHVQG